MEDNQKNDVSIIIPVCQYEKAYDTVKCLLTQKYPGEHEIIFLYDNVNVQMPLEWRFKLRSKGIKLIINENNRGLAGNYNDGIWTAKYGNIITIHEDIITQDNLFVINMLKALKYHDIVNAPVQVPDHIFQNYDFWNKMMLFRYAGIVTPAVGKATAYKKNLFTKVGFWDEETFKTAGEDMDFNMRLKAARIKSYTLPEQQKLMHAHEPAHANMAAMFRKEWQMGDAHGAFKRKYPLQAVGLFDFEVRLALLVLFIIIMPMTHAALLLLLPFLAVPIYQAMRGYNRSGWLPGLIFYPLLGPFVLITQTIAACRAWIKGKQTGGV